MATAGDGERPDAAENHLLFGRLRRPDLMDDCTHLRLVPALEPSLQNVRRGGLREHMLQVACPDCWLEVSVRLWRPESGGWYLKVRECWAAGRTWMFRYEGNTWRLGI